MGFCRLSVLKCVVGIDDENDFAAHSWSERGIAAFLDDRELAQNILAARRLGDRMEVFLSSWR